MKIKGEKLMKNKNYFWDDSDFESNFQRSEELTKKVLEKNGEDYEIQKEKFRVVIFLQNVETGNCLTGWTEGFTNENDSRDYLKFVEKISEKHPLI